MLALTRPPRAEPRLYAEWFEAELQQHQWDPDLEYVQTKQHEQRAASAVAAAAAAAAAATAAPKLFVASDGENMPPQALART